MKTPDDIPFISGAISGIIRGAAGAGATVALVGTAPATTTADAYGIFSFSSLANGSYAVTPTATGATFTPATQVVTVNGANVTVNFKSNPPA
jgi:hypothetical protein